MSVIHPPRIPDRTEPFESRIEAIGDEDVLDELLVDGGQWRGTRVDRLDIRRSLLQNMNLQDTELGRLELTDVSVDRCDAANARWVESALVRVRFRDSRLTGLDAAGSRFHHVVFERCNLDLGHFRLASFGHARFADCSMRETDFGGADLAGVRFSNCDLKNARMSGARLNGADLRGSDIEGMSAAPEDLRGVIVDPLQMPVLAWALRQHFGIVVKDLEVGEECEAGGEPESANEDTPWRKSRALKRSRNGTGGLPSRPTTGPGT